ncbi:MAG: ABC transporter ATP-binding protein [Spirochaetales bacterium]|nr:ABC transporter ATP-binding protein [Spirochaetales bacterium]
MNPQKGVLELSSVRRSYDNFTLDVSLAVGNGELVSLLGPSGSGKTTTLKLIAGFETADAGTVSYNGKDITAEKPWNRGFGYVPQNLVLFPHLDVGGNIAYGLRTKPISRAAVRRKVDELLGFVGLSGFGRRKIDTLSGGEQQRVALARAIAIEPGLLLLDEPFSALDAPLRREMRDEVRRITGELGISALFVTHNQDEGLSISDRVAIMSEGRVVQQDRPEKIFSRPVNEFVAGFIGAANILPVVVEEVRGGTVVLRGPRRLQAEVKPGTGFSKGMRVKLVVRPHCFSFCAPGSVNAIPVHVAARRFLGDRYEYVCRDGDAAYTVIDGERIDDGADVTIGFDPANGYLLP